MVVTCDQDFGTSVLGELDQVVVAPIGRNHPRRVDWIGKPDRFFFNALAEFINLVPSDAVPARYPRVEERLAYFAQELRTGDHFEDAVPPEIEESRCRPGRCEGSRDQTVSVDNGSQPSIRALNVGTVIS